MPLKYGSHKTPSRDKSEVMAKKPVKQEAMPYRGSRSAKNKAAKGKK